MLKLKKLAQEKGFKNPNQFARQAQLDQPLVRRYWDDTTSKYSKDALRQIARVLGVPVGELFEDDPG